MVMMFTAAMSTPLVTAFSSAARPASSSPFVVVGSVYVDDQRRVGLLQLRDGLRAARVRVRVVDRRALDVEVDVGHAVGVDHGPVGGGELVDGGAGERQFRAGRAAEGDDDVAAGLAEGFDERAPVGAGAGGGVGDVAAPRRGRSRRPRSARRSRG